MDAPSVQLLDAYERKSQLETISNFKVACALGMILVPAFAVIDFNVYPRLADEFLKMRLLCSALIGVFLAVLLTPLGRKCYRFFGVTLVLIPGSVISYMIWRTEGADSPYYAGLNLVLLVVGFVLRWTFLESLAAVGLVASEYGLACYWNGAAIALQGTRLNNLAFFLATGIIVVTGSYFFSRLRFREFVTRYQLDERTKELEEAIRKLREAEAQLIQQEKMASLGVMSAGIIHEINNPLNFAGTGLFTLRKKSKHIAPEQQSAYLELLTDVEEGINRVKSIVSDLRMFTHPDTESVDDVEITEVVTSTLRFLASELNDKVRVEQTLPPGLTVRANKNKLIHMLTNLVQNSLDALRRKSFDGSPRGICLTGTPLEAEGSISRGEPPTIRIEGRAEPDRVLLLVRDNGPGIAPENQPKIFDPFFTTKEVGEGMGLGLSICYRLIHEFGGEITVDSQPDHYCQFTLVFPTRKPNGTPA